MFDFLTKLIGWPLKLKLTRYRLSAKNQTSVVFIHGLGSSYRMWRPIIDKLKKDPKFDNIDILTVDLLGHGQTGRHLQGDYSVKANAKALHRTIRLITRSKRTILVGHSLGSLVAIQYAKAYKKSVDGLLLLSPPIYRKNNHWYIKQDDILKKLYQELIDNPKESSKLMDLVRKLYEDNDNYDFEDIDPETYLKTLQNAIINQTSYDDIQHLGLPIKILVGSFDPLVVMGNIKTIAKKTNVEFEQVLLASHDISPAYRQQIIKKLKDII